MQNTRWEILQILKRRGGSTVEDLANALAFAPMTVRQHLAILERDGLITSRESRKGLGRPSHLYSISPQGEELFPKGYAKLAGRLLREVSLLQAEEIAPLSEREKVAFLLQRLAEKVAAEYSTAIHGESLEKRGEEVVALLREREGTLSEWAKTEEGFQIQDFNCPFQRITAEEPELCAWHLHLLARMLQADVAMERCMARGDVCCRYLIQPAKELLGQQRELPWESAPVSLRSHARK